MLVEVILTLGKKYEYTVTISQLAKDDWMMIVEHKGKIIIRESIEGGDEAWAYLHAISKV